MNRLAATVIAAVVLALVATGAPRASAAPAPQASPTAAPSAAASPAAAPSDPPPSMIPAALHVDDTPTPDLEITVTPAPRIARVRPPAQTPSPTPGPADSTAIPTQPPTPPPIAAVQPTIPDSMVDPNVRSIMARPIPELSQFQWMLGTWRARNVVQLGSGEQHENGHNSYVFASTMKGRWIFGGDGQGSDYFYITFDPFARHWVLVRLNDNPAYGIWVSPNGWHESIITFTSNYSYVNGRQYRRRITFIHKDARTFGIYDEEELPSGQWTADEAAELTRQQ